jgi:uronate dehydrogenase
VTETILITGAAGTIGAHLRQSLRAPDRLLRLLDTKLQVALNDGEQAELLVGSFLERTTIDSACQGVDAVIHLGGLSTGGFTWEEYLEVNINGTFSVLDAARRVGTERVVFASSNHAVGFDPIYSGAVPDYLFPRPDSYYGVSKVAGEALCSLFHDRYQMDTIALRIGSYLERPTHERHLWSWLSPGDCTRLFEAALVAARPGFRIVWGVSANTRGSVSLEEGRAIGYVPRDNAEEFVKDVTTHSESDDPGDLKRIGGAFTALDFDHVDD